MNTTYFAELSRHLTARGMPDQEVAATVADLSGYLAESGSPDAGEEFGAPDVFADRLTHRDSGERPGAGDETWKWTSDIYTDRLLLNQYGTEGWEVEGIDFAGRFVCRRSPGTVMRWEYRREITQGAKVREALTAELAPDGWEVCGRWLYMTYFKRPLAATDGPAAELTHTPAPPARHVFFSAKYRGLIAMFAVSVVLLVLGIGFDVIDLDRPGVHYGILAAAAVGGLAGWYGVKRDITRGTQSPHHAKQ
ncbi:hypothetical protein N4G70_12980 [Streptomyces sp. ASQP_92]|uniref:hypothetical protein n=1 Tax=Streptomyces sp. ASQP_92 TaxID=2979116 RepID=UPI0021BE2FDD|nr:hypothetical protein [Streptomyces sp. ASQP_92]MCT9089777.1 hypothetical protein [Streptomyces sp. ASQP_92]